MNDNNNNNSTRAGKFSQKSGEAKLLKTFPLHECCGAESTHVLLKLEVIRSAINNSRTRLKTNMGILYGPDYFICSKGTRWLMSLYSCQPCETLQLWVWLNTFQDEEERTSWDLSKPISTIFQINESPWRLDSFLFLLFCYLNCVTFSGLGITPQQHVQMSYSCLGRNKEGNHVCLLCQSNIPLT